MLPVNARSHSSTASDSNPKSQHTQQEEGNVARQANQDAEVKTTESPKKSVLQQDEELRQKMAGIGGDGGEAGVEYEDGQPASMKRSVKNNMFRYI